MAGIQPLIYPGIWVLTHAAGLDRCMISANQLLARRSDFAVNGWIMDSGAFTRISAGHDHIPLPEYADMAHRWSGCGHLEAVVAQDYMCEQFVLAVTGATIAEHQAKTTDRYLRLRPLIDGPYLMPVIQGFSPEDYARHATEMAPWIENNARVGIGSVCKRQGRPDSLAAVLEAVLDVRGDWRLHGFGVKASSLGSQRVTDCLYSVDSMAWSFAARYEGRDGNSIDECRRWLERVEAIEPDGVTQLAML